MLIVFILPSFVVVVVVVVAVASFIVRISCACADVRTGKDKIREYFVGFLQTNYDTVVPNFPATVAEGDIQQLGPDTVAYSGYYTFDLYVLTLPSPLYPPPHTHTPTLFLLSAFDE